MPRFSSLLFVSVLATSAFVLTQPGCKTVRQINQAVRGEHGQSRPQDPQAAIWEQEIRGLDDSLAALRRSKDIFDDAQARSRRESVLPRRTRQFYTDYTPLFDAIRQVRTRQINALEDDLIAMAEAYVPYSNTSRPTDYTLFEDQHPVSRRTRQIQDEKTRVARRLDAQRRDAQGQAQAQAEWQAFADGMQRLLQAVEADRQRMIEAGVCLSCAGSGKGYTEARHNCWPCLGTGVDCLHCNGEGWTLERVEHGQCRDCGGTGRSR